MKTKKAVPQAVKQFAKEIGAPDAIICDTAWEQTSEALREFFIRSVLPCGCWGGVHLGPTRLSCIMGS